MGPPCPHGDCGPPQHLPLRQQTCTPSPFVLDGQGLAWAPGRVDRWSTGPGDPGLVGSLVTLCGARKSSPPAGLCFPLYKTEPVILASQVSGRMESDEGVPGSAQGHVVSSHRGELGPMAPSQVATRAIGADGNTLEPTWWCAL